MANKILVARGTKARIEEIKSTLADNELVYSTDTGELGVKRQEGNIEWVPNKAEVDTKLDTKVDKVSGKGLSTNDYTNTDKQSVEKIPAIEQDILDLESDKVDKNNPITAGTKAKITYDSKGLVTSGADLTEADIPTLPASKITQSTTARFVTDNEKATWNGKENSFTKNTAFNKNFGTTAGTVAQGNHLHTGVYEPANSNIQSHISSTSNPHNVSKSQVGLGNVDNTSDGTKYVQGLRETRANVNTKIWTGTQAQYDAIVTKDATTLYFITE